MILDEVEDIEAFSFKSMMGLRRYLAVLLVKGNIGIYLATDNIVLKASIYILFPTVQLVSQSVSQSVSIKSVKELS